MKNPQPSLKQRALKLLSMREYSRQELINKLLPHAPDVDEIRQSLLLNQVLDELSTKDFLNEVRLVESMIHTQSKKWGTARIRQTLVQKGLDEAGEMALANGLHQLKDTELERAQAIWQKKFGGQVATTPQMMAKQQRFLASRGFCADVVMRVIRAKLNRKDET